jgi:hypothetical protein
MYRQKPRCAPFSDESRRESPEEFSRARSYPSPAAFAHADGFMSLGRVSRARLASTAVQRSRYTSVGVQILTLSCVPNCLNTSAPGYRILGIAPIDHAAQSEGGRWGDGERGCNLSRVPSSPQWRGGSGFRTGASSAISRRAPTFPRSWPTPGRRGRSGGLPPPRPLAARTSPDRSWWPFQGDVAQLADGVTMNG